MKRTLRVFVVALGAVTLLAVGCTSSTPDSAVPTTTAAPTTRTTTGVTDTEIKVSALGFKASYGESLVGAQARFKRENDAGGVHGRKIVLTDFFDDAQTPATNSQMATKIVEQDKPFAVVPVMTASFPAAAYLDEQGVPFVGWGIVPDWCGKNAGFSLTGCTDNATSPVVTDSVPTKEKVFADKTAKGKKIALIGTDNDSGKSGLKGFAEDWVYNGAEVVYTSNAIPLPPTVVSDFTPYAQAILDSNDGKGPDLVEAVSSTTDGVGLAKKLRELGYTKPILEYSLYDPRIVGLSTDIHNALTFAAWEQTETPAVQQMIKDVDALGTEATKGLAMEAGYWSADLFIEILKKAGPDLTRESFIAAGNNDFNYDGQDATADLSFPINHTQQKAGLTIVLGTGTEYEVISPFETQPDISRTEFDKSIAAQEKK